MISVCIPTYNAAAYIGETLESLTRQTYTDFEVIISDNASTDGTKDVVESFFRRFPRIRYYRNESNIGYTANVNQAVRYAEAEYVAIYHADDIYLPDILEQEFSVLDSNPEVAGAFCRSRYYRGRDNRLEENPLPEGVEDFLERTPGTSVLIGTLPDFSKALLRYGDFLTCPSFLTRKTVFTNIGGFNDVYPTGEDLHLWLRLLGAGYKLAVLDQPLMYYRISENQGAAGLRKHIHQSPQFKIFEDLVLGHPYVDDQDMAVYKERKARDLLSAAVNAFQLGNIPLAFYNLRHSKKIHVFNGFNKYSLTQKIPLIALLAATMLGMARRIVSQLSSQ